MSSKSEWKSTQAHQRPRFKFFLKFQIAKIVRLQFVHWRETSISMTWVSDPYLPYPPFHHPSPDQVLVAYLPCHPFPYHRPSPCHLCHLSIRCIAALVNVAGCWGHLIQSFERKGCWKFRKFRHRNAPPPMPPLPPSPPIGCMPPLGVYCGRSWL